MTKLVLLLLMSYCLALHAQDAFPQPTTPPARPRLLFSATQLASVQQRIAVPGSRAASAYAALSSSYGFQCGTATGACPGGSQESWRVYRTLRFMTEQAFRWRVSGDAAAGSSAKALLCSGTWNCVNVLTPTGLSGYVNASYPAAMAIAYDLIHPLLTPAERTTVVAKLELWVAALLLGSSGVGPLSSYDGATDNHSFALATGISMTLLAIWGDSTLPLIPQTVSTWLDFLRDGLNDAISMDGSVDEAYGYACYGNVYSLNALIAGMNCGFGDRIAGTNILKTPRWYAHSIIGNTFSWMGDSGPTHRGLRFDPVLYYAVARENDAVGLNGLLRIETLQPIDANASTFAFSAWIPVVLHYPESLAPQAPAQPSAFFRDNLNQVPTGQSAQWNKTHNYEEQGTGGLALLHTGASGAAAFDVCHIIRDEWMNHAHEDDGHLSLAAGGVAHFIDRGYAQNGGAFANAQHSDHNIVTVQGAAAYGGANHFNPPGTEGRFNGTRVASLFAMGSGVDYIRGSHAAMWMMQQAERSILLVRDAAQPFMVVLDGVQANGTGAVTMEQRWNSAGPASGSGTVASPMLVTSAGVALRSVWLDGPVSVIPGAAATSPYSGINYWPHVVSAPATGLKTFMSVHGVGTLQQYVPAVQPVLGTVGGSFSMGGQTHKILARATNGTLGDAETNTDGRMLWLRKAATGALNGYALLEGSSMNYAGWSLVSSTQPLCVSVCDGRVSVQRIGTSTVPVEVSLHIPFGWPVNSVYVEGVATLYSQTGTRLIIGGGAATPVLWGSSARFHTFTEAQWLDGTPSSALVPTTDGRVTASSGTATFRLRGGTGWHQGNMWIGCDVQAVGAINSVAGSIRLGSTSGGAEILDASLRRVAGGVAVDVPLALGGSASVIYPASGEVRVALAWNSTSGMVQFYNRTGQLMGSILRPPVNDAQQYVTFTTTAAGILDDCSAYDSAHAASRGEGVSVWVLPSGRLGWSVCAPNYLGALGYSIEAGGWSIPAEMIGAFLTAGQFQEQVALVSGAPPASGLEEVAFESQVPLVTTAPGIPYNVAFVSAAGSLLIGGAWFAPSPRP